MKWNVGTKIAVGFGIALAIFVIVGVVSYGSTNQLIAASQWRQHTYEVLGELSQLSGMLREAEVGQRSYVLTGDGDYLDRFRNAEGAIEASQRKARDLTKDNPRQQERFDTLDPLVRSRLAVSIETIETYQTRGPEAAVEIVKTGKGKGLSDNIDKLLSAMAREENDLLQKRIREADQGTRNAKATLIYGTLAALLIAGLAGLLITRNIAGPLRELTTVAERIIVGDLNVAVPDTARSDEVGVLERAFARMTQSLRGMAGAAEQIAAGDLRSTVKPQSPDDVLGNAFARMSENLRQQIGGMVEGAAVLGSAASEIVASTAQLAASASESAAAVSETTTTVEEIRQTAQMASQKAKAVSDNAQKAAQISQTGRKSIDDMANGMDRIRQQMDAIAESMMRLSEQSQTIGQIIATVEDLAAQSNLLAVNAAIEAAKAGEQGKGFGVVAQEVKSLAEQSRQATERVRTILGDIQKATTAAVMATEQGSKAVEAGSRQTELAGDSIQALAGSVSEAAQAATQIAASSQQQLVGMDQVAVAMENIKQASTQNVASAKQLEICGPQSERPRAPAQADGRALRRSRTPQRTHDLQGRRISPEPAGDLQGRGRRAFAGDRHGPARARESFGSGSAEVHHRDHLPRRAQPQRCGARRELQRDRAALPVAGEPVRFLEARETAPNRRRARHGAQRAGPYVAGDRDAGGEAHAHRPPPPHLRTLLNLRRARHRQLHRRPLHQGKLKRCALR